MARTAGKEKRSREGEAEGGRRCGYGGVAARRPLSLLACVEGGKGADGQLGLGHIDVLD